MRSRSNMLSIEKSRINGTGRIYSSRIGRWSTNRAWILGIVIICANNPAIHHIIDYSRIVLQRNGTIDIGNSCTIGCRSINRATPSATTQHTTNIRLGENKIIISITRCAINL